MLFQRSLAIREKVLGPAHADVSVSLNNLASLYEDMGKYAEAEPLLRRALGIDEKVFGDHPELAADVNNLALLYQEQGKFAEAEPLLRRALAIMQMALGPEDPGVAAASTISPSSSMARESMARPSRSIGARCLSKKRRSDPTTPMWRLG